MPTEAEAAMQRRQLQRKFARACDAVGAVVKSGTANTGSYTYSYTKLEDVLSTVTEALDAQDLSLAQPLAFDEHNNLTVQTMITDRETGDYLLFTGAGVPAPRDPQAAGSAITYFRRYALVSLFGIHQDDDDGAQAHRATSTPQARTGAEVEMRRIIGELSQADRAAIQTDFQENFGTTLTNMPESRHGDALGWVQWWLSENTGDAVSS